MASEQKVFDVFGRWAFGARLSERERLKERAQSLAAYAEDLGKDYEKTMICVRTEFGRRLDLRPENLFDGRDRPVTTDDRLVLASSRALI